mmetsp:Transcript_61263/g.200293  ORF Transcript_61263/g.200293 Transcript_61263/m.200293 type:complete len:300 (+) Transcript_61263:274-1173(+)
MESDAHVAEAAVPRPTHEVLHRIQPLGPAIRRCQAQGSGSIAFPGGHRIRSGLHQVLNHLQVLSSYGQVKRRIALGIPGIEGGLAYEERIRKRPFLQRHGLCEHGAAGGAPGEEIRRFAPLPEHGLHELRRPGLRPRGHASGDGVWPGLGAHGGLCKGTTLQDQVQYKTSAVVATIRHGLPNIGASLHQRREELLGDDLAVGPKADGPRQNCERGLRLSLQHQVVDEILFVVLHGHFDQGLAVVVEVVDSQTTGVEHLVEELQVPQARRQKLEGRQAGHRRKGQEVSQHALAPGVHGRR